MSGKASADGGDATLRSWFHGQPRRFGWQDLLAWYATRQMLRQQVAALEAADIFTQSHNIQELIQMLSRQRGREIRLKVHRLPAFLTALVRPRRSFDLIFFVDQVHPLLGQHAILHELAHLLLGHVALDPSVDDAEDLTTADLIFGLHRGDRITPALERDAERLAYHLRTRWEQAQPPSFPQADGNDPADQEVWNRFQEQLRPFDHD